MTDSYQSKHMKTDRQTGSFRSFPRNWSTPGQTVVDTTRRLADLNSWSRCYRRRPWHI